MPMSFAPIGSKVEIVKILMGQTLNKKLMEMGLNTGSKMQIVKNDGGQIILGIAGSKLALGQGMGQKIMVKAV